MSCKNQPFDTTAILQQNHIFYMKVCKENEHKALLYQAGI